MTETSSKVVLRSTTVMFLFVGLVGMWMGGCETQKQKVDRLIRQLQDQYLYVRGNAAEALGKIGPDAKDVICSDTKLLQDKDNRVRVNAAWADRHT